MEIENTTSLLPGTLELLILKAVSFGPEHGYGILLRIETLARGSLAIEQGSLYPALYRLEKQGLLSTEWGISDNNRRARFYSLTRAGGKRLEHEIASWRRFASVMEAVLNVVALEA